MKRSFTACAVLAMALAGCNQGTPGGPGSTGTNPTYGQADDSFNLSVPMMSSALQQGEKIEATVGIKRAKNFDEDVALQFADVPAGVTIDPARPVIKHGDADAKLTFKAGDEAPVGDFKVKVTGHPTKGSDALVEFKLTIAAKDSFTLSVVRPAADLKQGETQTVSVAIQRDKTFDQDVALKFGAMPTGVTLTPDAPMIKRGELETKLMLTAANDAALGDFAIMVKGHPTQGVDAANEIKFTVVKE